MERDEYQEAALVQLLDEPAQGLRLEEAKIELNHHRIDMGSGDLPEGLDERIIPALSPTTTNEYLVRLKDVGHLGGENPNSLRFDPAHEGMCIVGNSAAAIPGRYHTNDREAQRVRGRSIDSLGGATCSFRNVIPGVIRQNKIPPCFSSPGSLLTAR